MINTDLYSFTVLIPDTFYASFKIKEYCDTETLLHVFFVLKPYAYHMYDGGHGCLDGPYEVSAVIDQCLQTQILVTFVP